MGAGQDHRRGPRAAARARVQRLTELIRPGCAPLADLLRAVSAGRAFPPDGRIEVHQPPEGAVAAVLGFTAGHVVAADVTPDSVRDRLDPTDLSAPLGVHFLRCLAERLGRAPGPVDVVLVADGVADPGLDDHLGLRTADGTDHPRIRRAHRHRTAVRAHQTDGGVLVLGHGLAGRWEVAIEVDPPARGRGLGRRMAAAARRLVPSGESVWAQVAPGNAASLRAFLAAGYRPVGAEVLFPDRAGD